MPSSKRKINIEEIKNEYFSLSTLIEKYCIELKRQIELLCNENNVNLGFPIQHRTKTLNSIIEKINSNRFNVKKSIKEIQDLAGLRITLIFKRDVKKVAKIIESNLSVLKKYNTQDRLDNNQFGYASLHFVVEVPDEWLKVPTFQGFTNLKAEIQIRTLSQHTWAEASKIIQYKHVNSTPPELLRTISRVSALLETVDLEFEQVLKEKEAYRKDIDETLEQIDKSIKLNVDILEKILDSELPQRYKTGEEEYGILIEDLSKAGINDISGLINLINSQKESAFKEDLRISNYIINNYDPENDFNMIEIEDELFEVDNFEDIKRRGAFYVQDGLIKHMLTQKEKENDS